MGAVLLLAFCLYLGAELSSLVGFNYIDSLATAFKKKKSQVSWPWSQCVGFDRILLLNEAILAEMGKRK